MDRVVDTGLPSGFLLGDVSRPLSEADLLFGGEVPAPPVVEETGDRIGDGDRLLATVDRLVRPARCRESREPASPAWPWCSAWTTSAKLMKLRRRTSALLSSPPELLALSVWSIGRKSAAAKLAARSSCQLLEVLSEIPVTATAAGW